METVMLDPAGRKLSLRRWGVLETLRLFKALGPELSMNQAYVGFATAGAQVAMIDEVPLPFPVNEAGVEAVLERLGLEAVHAVGAMVRPPPPAIVVADAGN